MSAAAIESYICAEDPFSRGSRNNGENQRTKNDIKCNATQRELPRQKEFEKKLTASLLRGRVALIVTTSVWLDAMGFYVKIVKACNSPLG